jgi:Patatin-like phospholipase
MLENEIKEVIGNSLDFKEQNIRAESVSMCDGNGIPTFVVATKRHHINSPEPKLFRSYECKGTLADRCMLWEAARATTAAPTFFREIVITYPPPGGPFVDGGVQHNNPGEVALEEADRVWPNEPCILVSIGTGIPSREWFPAPIKRGILSRLPGMKAKQGLTTSAQILLKLGTLATSSEAVHNRLNKRSKENGSRFSYYRFNVDGLDGIGLEEWKRAQELDQVTDSYLQTIDSRDLLAACIKALIPPTLGTTR